MAADRFRATVIRVQRVLGGLGLCGFLTVFVNALFGCLAIGTCLVRCGNKRQLKIVVGWLALHEEEVYSAWSHAVKGEHFEKIAPME